MATFEEIDYTDFLTNYGLKDGERATAIRLNLPLLRLKKETNVTYNSLALINGMPGIPWRNVEPYIVGDIVQNTLADNKFYRARKNNTGIRPDLSPDDWEVAEISDYTNTLNPANILYKNNQDAYTPTGDYNPATKKYVDVNLSYYLLKNEKAVDSAKLNGEVVTNTLSDSMTKPASVKLVNVLNTKTDTKLDASEFNANNIISKLETVDGALSGLDADKLDGKSSEEFMFRGDSNNFDTLKTPGSYKIMPGATGAPNGTSTFSVIVGGHSGKYNQVATDITLNKLYYRSFNTSWSAWKEFASATGNVATADKWSSTMTITLAGDTTGNVTFDGSADKTLTVSVLNDSHIHDVRYYTKTTSDGRFLGLHADADNSILFNSIPLTDFIRNNVDSTNSADYTWTGENTFNDIDADNLTLSGDLTVNGTTTTINSSTIQVDDKNIELGTVALPTDITADQGGITLKGSTDKSIIWDKAQDKWLFTPGIVADITGTADNANTLDNLDSTQFLRSDDDDIDTGKLTINKDIGNTEDYSSGQFELKCEDGKDVSMGFHRTGYTACQLRHSSNGLILSGTTQTATADMTVTGKFIGTSTSAEYADLAEKYTSAHNIPKGTIVTIPENEDYEIKTCYKNDVPFGVVSDKPGFILNEKINGIEIALIGQTPIRINGPVKKGQPITIDNKGVGKACDYSIEHHKIVGTALESNLLEEEKLVRCTIS